MGFQLVQYLSAKTFNRSDILTDLSEKLNGYFTSNTTSEEALEEIIIGIVFSEFDAIQYPDIKEFGNIIEVKYNKRRKSLTYSIVLEYGKYKKLDDNVLFCGVVLQEIKNSLLKIASDNAIPSLTRILSHLDIFIKKFTENPLSLQTAPKIEVGNSQIDTVGINKRIGVKDFWRLIDSAFKDGEFIIGIESITKKLSKKSDDFIFGFELTLRDLALKLATPVIENTVQDILGGFISSDSFLYFRCRIITLGQEFYQQVLKSEEALKSVDIKVWRSGEFLLYVTDNALKEKYKEKYYDSYPRENADGIIGQVW